MCFAHTPRWGNGFCYSCNTEWRHGVGRRNLLLVAIGCAVAIAILLVSWLVSPGHSSNVALVFVAVFAGAIAMRVAESVVRARFRPAGSLPRAGTRLRRG
jgi:hypothetical protein